MFGNLVLAWFCLTISRDLYGSIVLKKMGLSTDITSSFTLFLLSELLSATKFGATSSVTLPLASLPLELTIYDGLLLCVGTECASLSHHLSSSLILKPPQK
jgi:hypothetical protein